MCKQCIELRKELEHFKEQYAKVVNELVSIAKKNKSN